MKFSIRFADQIVGALIILALGMVIFVIFMLGSNQRWFSDDYYFKSYFPTASGLSQNMAVQYKGFTIGYVKSVRLAEDDQVEVRFTIFDTYIDRVRSGSIVEVLVSPIGGLGGSQFLFHPGKGTELLPEGETIPSAGSTEGRRLLAIGLAQRPERDDNINNIVNSVGNTLETLNALLTDVEQAFVGTDKTSLGRTMGGLEAASAGLQVMAEKLPTDFEVNLDSLMAQLEPVLTNLRNFSDRVADPDGSISAILDSEGDVYRDLSKSLDALSGTLRNLEQTTDFIPAQLIVWINDVNEILAAAKTNGLIKGGIPEHKEPKAGGARTRDMEF